MHIHKKTPRYHPHNIARVFVRRPYGTTITISLLSILLPVVLAPEKNFTIRSHQSKQGKSRRRSEKTQSMKPHSWYSGKDTNNGRSRKASPRWRLLALLSDGKGTPTARHACFLMAEGSAPEAPHNIMKAVAWHSSKAPDSAASSEPSIHAKLSTTQRPTRSDLLL